MNRLGLLLALLARRARARAAQHVLQLAQHGLVPGHGRRLRESHRHQGCRRAEGDRRNAGAGEGRARQSRGATSGGRAPRTATCRRRRTDCSRNTARPTWPALRLGAAHHRISKNRVAGVYGGILSLGYNTEIGDKKKLPVPKCWKDLANPALKGEVMLGNPNSSGTAYLMIASLVQVMGEDEAFRYMVELNKNVTSYARSALRIREVLIRRCMWQGHGQFANMPDFRPQRKVMHFTDEILRWDKKGYLSHLTWRHTVAMTPIIRG